MINGASATSSSGWEVLASNCDYFWAYMYQIYAYPGDPDYVYLLFKNSTMKTVDEYYTDSSNATKYVDYVDDLEYNEKMFLLGAVIIVDTVVLALIAGATTSAAAISAMSAIGAGTATICNFAGKIWTAKKNADTTWGKIVSSY